MTVRIVTDSTSDLPAALAEEHSITTLPAYINIGEESYLDGIELTRETFYNQLPTYTSPPTTAAPAVGVFSETYEKLAAEGATAIISIHLAANLSGLLNAARLGAQATDNVPVSVFDSQQLSMGLGFLALAAARAAARGETVAEIISELEAQRARTHVFAMLDTLEYLRRSGRVSWTEFGLGTLLRIKPLLHVQEGQVNAIDRVRTRGRALRQLIQHVEALGPLEEIALLHTADPAGVEELREKAEHLFPEGDEPVAVEVTPTIGAHIGPGALGFACVAAGD